MDGYALITGAGKGIGRSIALQLAQKGHNLLLVSRSESDLKSLATQLITDHEIKIEYLAIDLSVNGAALKIFNWVASLTVPISILINNAGHGLWGDFEALPLDGQTNMMQVNMNALVELSHLFIPLLKQQKQAHLLNIASTAAYQSVPVLAVYSATKAFVLSFSRALRYELKDSPIAVSCLSPGPTDTGFAKRAGMEALAELAEKFNMQADDVARIGLKGMFNKKAEIVPGLLNRLSVFGVRHIPKSFSERIAANLYKH
ncbi:SDR family NAD(P)-dependent oxidoreductase [Mucilaginibacter celer]|uniref:NADP-dependent 3-hydroxy acid dehydrogenase YdfG n=2 Tax=Mucilaginibacter celer TaxID=2305508 RepID=A0A494VZZ3_9SPHI|nr:SDR family NAD(P)-dependent oxidoreductase [Mucilaginibacter celer]